MWWQRKKSLIEVEPDFGMPALMYFGAHAAPRAAASASAARIVFMMATHDRLPAKVCAQHALAFPRDCCATMCDGELSARRRPSFQVEISIMRHVISRAAARAGRWRTG
jgi:hypothetical protein